MGDGRLLVMLLSLLFFEQLWRTAIICCVCVLQYRIFLIEHIKFNFMYACVTYVPNFILKKI